MKPLSFLFLTIILMSCNQKQPSVNEWRGPNRSGVYQESDLLKSWHENGPELIWEFNELGSGYGSPTITNKYIFIVGTEDSISSLFAFDLKGNLLYKSRIGVEWIVNYPGSRCAPTVIDDMVYVMTGKGDVACLEMHTGNLIWKINMLSDFDGVAPRFGFSQSLAVEGEKVFCCPGGIENNVVALNRFSGELVWSSKGKGERPGYNPPKVIECGKLKIFTTFSAYHLMGFDVETGELLWIHEQVNIPEDKKGPGTGDTHANTILFEDNILYYVEGDGNCAVALQVSEDGKSIKQLWNNAVVDNFMGGIIKLDNFIYSCGYSTNNLVKVDAQSGAVVESLAIGRGTLISADGMLYYYNMQGEVHLVDIDGDEMHRVSLFKIDKGSKEHFAHPVIKNGILYLRHGDFLGAYSIKN